MADCDPAGISRALGAEEAWLETAGYLVGQGRQSWTAEADLAFSRRLGMEIDLPAWMPRDGRFSKTLGAGLKVPLVQDCRRDGLTTLLTVEGEGQYHTGSRPAQAGDGDAVTGQIEWALERRPRFFTGEAGHTTGFGPSALAGWFANASLGQDLGVVRVQLEGAIDNESLPARPHRVEGTVTPQVALQLSSAWILTLGEQRAYMTSVPTPRWSTWFMVEHEFD